VFKYPNLFSEEPLKFPQETTQTLTWLCNSIRRYIPCPKSTRIWYFLQRKSLTQERSSKRQHPFS